MNGENSYYLNENGTLKDGRVIEDLYKAIDMYENGEIVETHDILLYIVNAIRKCTIEWLFNGGGYMEVKDYLPKKIRDKVENIIVEADFDYDKNRSVQHYFVYLTSGERFDATTIKELKEKARQMN